MTKTAWLILAIAAAGPAQAQPAQSVAVTAAWARATSASQKVGGVFLTLTDTGAPDRLVSASSPIADMLELHETTDDAGVMRMRPVPPLELPPNRPVALKPGGYHLMAMGLKRKLTAGETFPVTLTFEKSPAVTVIVIIGTAGASEAPAGK